MTEGITDKELVAKLREEASEVADAYTAALLRTAAERLEGETIVAAAHLYRCEGSEDPRAVPVTISALPPARHHNLFALVGGKRPDESGFLTSTGRFVGRVEALQIAKASGQPMIDHPSRHPTQLFSEDLW